MVTKACRGCKTPFTTDAYPYGWDKGLCNVCNAYYEYGQLEKGMTLKKWLKGGYHY